MYDALLIVAFGGPEGPEEVLPFLENVLRGRNVPRQRMLQVAEHYYQFGGVSPHNDQIRALVASLQTERVQQGPQLPIYWGNRNWRPYLADALGQMTADGIGHALAFFTSPYSSYSSCRQYREDIEQARLQVLDSPQVDKIRAYFNHPGFIAASADRLRQGLELMEPGGRDTAHVVFTAHSLPSAMADNCDYQQQLEETCRLTSAAVRQEKWTLVYQSRSGPPSQPWLEPDICDFLRQLHDQGERNVVIMPIGFISDHMEVVYDLDTEARGVCDELGIHMVRAGTVGTHPQFVNMIRELVVERMQAAGNRPALGNLGPRPDACPVDCCRP